MGKYVKSNAENAWVIGKGVGNSFGLLSNTTPNSLMIGFNTTRPSFFIQAFNGHNAGYVGIHTIDPR